jgi:hypothetical protein
METLVAAYRRIAWVSAVLLAAIAAWCLIDAAHAQVGSFSNGFGNGVAQGMALGRALRGNPYQPPPAPTYQEPVYQVPPPVSLPPTTCTTMNLGGGMWTTNCN